MNKIKKLTATILCLLTITSLTACKGDEDKDPLLDLSKEELVQMIYSANQATSEALDKADELQTALDMRDNKEERGTIKEIEDGSKRRTFTTVNNTISLPVDFAYPGTEMTAEDASLNLNSSVKILKPSPTWASVFDGTTLNLYNLEEEIAGNITVGQLTTVGQDFKVADLQDYVTNTLLVDVPYESATWTKLFLNDRQRGVDVTCKVLIDEAPAMMRCGIVGSGEISLQYMFVYKGEKDAIRDDLVRALLRNITIRNSSLSISTN